MTIEDGCSGEAVILLAENVEDVRDASAWVIVFASKVRLTNPQTHILLMYGRSVRLPDATYATASIMAPLLTAHLASGAPEPTYTLIQRALATLIHHVKNTIFLL